ncbi:MAG: hypothetical protein AAGJ46_10750 [Planctomycetota bacterium]
MPNSAVAEPSFDPSSGSPEEVSTGPVCQKCDQPIGADQTTVCPHCGWYASAGTFVEIEPEWESQGASETKKTTLEIWSTLIPLWGWIAIGSFVAAIAMSVAVRLLVTEASTRTVWAVTQLLGGLVLALTVHVVAFVTAAFDDPDIGVGDLFVNPLKGWRKLLPQMPRRQWLVDAFLFCVASSIGAAAIIGGIPYDRVWDWGISAPVKKDLRDAIAQHAGPASDQDMEEAMKAFAEDAGMGPGDGAFAKDSKDGPKILEQKTIDALILGYHLNRDGHVHELLLATEVNGKLMYAGRVTPELAPDENIELVSQLVTASSPQPLVTAPEGAEWVKPRFTCRVNYYRRVESGRLQGIKWEKMLGEVKLPW